MSTNSPNMSYCQFENTLAAMQQVIETLREIEDTDVAKMSEQERRAFHQMYYHGQSIADQMSTYYECFPDDVEDHPA